MVKVKRKTKFYYVVQLNKRGVMVQERDWKLKQLQDMFAALDTPQKRFEKVIDEFKTKKHEWFARRHFKNVIQEVKNYKRPSITIELPVEQTDPPTLSAATLKSKLDDIDFHSYGISFSITNESDVIGETGEIEMRQQKTSAMAPINRMKTRKNGIGALKGFLEQYMKRMTKSYGLVTKITLQLTRQVKKPAALTPLKLGMQVTALLMWWTRHCRIVKITVRLCAPKFGQSMLSISMPVSQRRQSMLCVRN